MNARSSLVATLVLCLLADGFCLPYRILRKRDTDNNELESNSEAPATTAVQNTSSSEKPEVSNELPPPIPYNDDDDDDDFENLATSSSGDNDGGGSNIFSLLRLAGAILPSSSNQIVLLRNIIRQLIKLNQPKTESIRRQFVADNEIEINLSSDLKAPPFQRQVENSNESDSNSNDESNESDNAAEESVEEPNGKNSKENSASNDASVNDNSDYDSDEPPGGGDGQGGGILGLLAGLSGGEDGQSDLGSLLATVSGIVANLSGDGIDLNALIASGIGLFVGLLSEGEENPGAVIASYLLTSLDTITGGGSKNNGAFFGTFLSKLIKGTSAAGGSEESSEEIGNKTKMSDSAGFFAQDPADAPSPLWTLKLDILRALVQFGTTLLGMASSSVFSFSG